MRWMTAVAALSLLAVSIEPVGMAIEKPNTEATEQKQIQVPGQESGSAQQPPGSTKRQRTPKPKKVQGREKRAKKRAAKREKKEAAKATKAAKAKEPASADIKSRIAKAADPSLKDRPRYKAILALGRSDHPEADAALLELGRNRKEPVHIRVWALQNLGRENQSELMGPLREILQDPEEPPLVRAEAAAGLGRIGTPVAVEALLAALDDKAPPAVRVRAIFALQERVPDRKIELLGRLLNDEQIAGEHRAVAAKLLGLSGNPGAADPLIKAIATRPKVASSPQNSGGATASAPGNAGGSGSAAPPAASSAESMETLSGIESLVAAEERRSNFRLFSVVGLGRLKEKRAIPTLLEALKSDPDPEVRAESVRTLLILAGPGAEDAFIGALKDEDPRVRLESAVALKQVGGQKAVKPFIHALKDSNRRVRFQAAEGLGRLGPTVANEAIDPLKEAAEQEKIDVVKKAQLAALEKLLVPAPSNSDKDGGS